MENEVEDYKDIPMKLDMLLLNSDKLSHEETEKAIKGGETSGDSCCTESRYLIVTVISHHCHKTHWC